MRILNFRFGVYGRDATMWAMRLGVRQPYGRQAAHGLHQMTHNEHTLTNHPDWFALYGGKRHTQPGQRLNQLCYSNEELLEATVRYARAQFDHFDMDVVSIMPPDGYTAICQCELCEGKDTPERGYRGALSNYVWDFVNRVAKEVGKTHPGQEDFQLRLRNLHRAAAEHRQAGAERAGHHRRRPSTDQRKHATKSANCAATGSRRRTTRSRSSRTIRSPVAASICPPTSPT